MSPTAATGWPEPTRTLWKLDNLVMHSKGRHEKQNDQYVQRQRERRASSSILTRAR